MSLFNFLKMNFKFFNCIFFFCYFVSINKGYSLIFESVVSKIWFDSLLKKFIISYYQLLGKHFLDFGRSLTQWFFSVVGKEILGTIIFPIFFMKTSLSHNCFPEFFIHKGRLVTSDMFFLFRGINMKYLWENILKR